MAAADDDSGLGISVTDDGKPAAPPSSTSCLLLERVGNHDASPAPPPLRDSSEVRVLLLFPSNFEELEGWQLT